MKTEELKQYKDNLYSSLSRDLDAFEKNFILVATAILAFSIGFIKDIVKIENAVALFLLFGGWLLILVAVGFMMFTFLASANGSNKLWKNVDDFIINKKLFKSDAEFSDDDAATVKTSTNKILFEVKAKLRVLRNASVLLFVLGMLSLSVFVGINLTLENQASTKTKVLNVQKTRLIIRTGNIETSTNDSLIILENKTP